MSVAGKSIGDTTPVRAVQPVAQYDPVTGAATGSSATADGSTPIAGGDGNTEALATNPLPTRNIGASSTFRIVSAAASTNASSVKASAGNVGIVTGYNANAAARYLKFYNKASAPTVGTDTPIWTEYLAPQSKFSIPFAGLYFSTGIALALTTGSADADTGALTAADILALNVAYA